MTNHMGLYLILNWFSYIGLAVFAISGALMALRKEHDIVGVAFVATLTGVGGGTVRDILLGATPVTWVKEPADLLICVVCAVAISLANNQLLGKRLTWLLYADAAGLALFAVLGAAHAEQLGAHPFVCILFAAISATFGGVIRDVMLNETPILFQKDIYVSAALLGGGVYILLPEAIGFEGRSVLGLVSGLGLRVSAIKYELSLPFPKYLSK